MHRLSFSKAEGVAVIVAAVAVLLMAFGAPEMLEYRRASLASEPWRVVSGHLLHINGLHAMINALALIIVARLFAADLSTGRQAGVLVAAALVISAGLAFFYPQVSWYRGLSGVVHALFFAGAITWLLRAGARNVRTLWLPAALLAGGWIKVALEQPSGDALPHAEWLGAAVVPQAHLIGAACGTAVGLAFALTDRRREQQRGKQQQLQSR